MHAKIVGALAPTSSQSGLSQDAGQMGRSQSQSSKEQVGASGDAEAGYQGRSRGVSHAPGHATIQDDCGAPLVAADQDDGGSSGGSEIPPLGEQIKGVLLGSKINALLITVPLAFAAHYAKWSDAVIFFLAFFALIPLAKILGDFTEDLSARYGGAIGALLNASFGNATEVIVCLMALNKGLFVIIKQSMMGSVIGNSLLVLGSALVMRSMYRPPVRAGDEGESKAREVTFSFVPDGQAKNFIQGLGLYASLLLLAGFGLVVPTVFAQLHTNKEHPEYSPSNQTVLDLSRVVSIAMCISYGLFIFFQLKYAYVFSEDQEDESPGLYQSVAIIGLAIVTVLIAFMSEFLVDSIEPAAKSMGIAQAFIAVILLPIVGNAGEHATGIVAAYQGKMDLAIGIAIGSSIQIAGFVVPFLVLVSWCWQGTYPDDRLRDENNNMNYDTAGALDLNFHPFPTIVMFVSILIVNTIVYNSHSNWLEGATLLISYIIIAMSFWYVPEGANT